MTSTRTASGLHGPVYITAETALELVDYFERMAPIWESKLVEPSPVERWAYAILTMDGGPDIWEIVPGYWETALGRMHAAVFDQRDRRGAERKP